jgi:hypothetical protein
MCPDIFRVKDSCLETSLSKSEREHSMKKVVLPLSLFSVSLTAQVPTSANPSTKGTVPDVAQTSRRLQPNEHFLNLAGATTIDAPPEGFDPITASDEELNYYGLPPHPDRNTEPERFAHWARAMKASRTRIVPILQQTDNFHSSIQRIKAANAGSDLSASGTVMNDAGGSYNWTGYASPSGTSTFYYVVSDMIVPVAEQPLGTCTGGWVHGSGWVGIDGVYVTDLLQAGVEFDSICANSLNGSAYNLWYEWLPFGAVNISNFQVYPGDDIFVEVWHTSPTQGFAFFLNHNTGQSTQVGFTAPPGVSLVGNSAEWVVERPKVNGALSTLTNFTSMPFYDAYGVTESGIKDTVGALPITMFDKSNNLLAFPVLIGKESFVAQTPGH